jgi:hypothetical protein
MKQLWFNIRYYHAICLEERRETMEILTQDSQFMNPDLNLGHPEYGTEVLLIFSVQ